MPSSSRTTLHSAGQSRAQFLERLCRPLRQRTRDAHVTHMARAPCSPGWRAALPSPTPCRFFVSARLSSAQARAP